jgi:hypothetical protein
MAPNPHPHPQLPCSDVLPTHAGSLEREVQAVGSKFVEVWAIDPTSLLPPLNLTDQHFPPPLCLAPLLCLQAGSLEREVQAVDSDFSEGWVGATSHLKFAPLNPTTGTPYLAPPPPPPNLPAGWFPGA